MGDYAALVDAPIMIGCRSTYSLWAALMNRNGRAYLPVCVLYLENSAVEIEGVHWVHPDGAKLFVRSVDVAGMGINGLVTALSAERRRLMLQGPSEHKQLQGPSPPMDPWGGW